MSPRKFSFPREKIKVLLLEGVHDQAVERLREEKYTLEIRPGAMSEEELLGSISEIHLLGIRSKTQLTEKVLRKAKRLLAVGAFCIGTNQIDTGAALDKGVPVFNAPFANTRSVAELIIADVIMLFRGLYDKVRGAHSGQWAKSAAGSVEVRGKTLGIVGYGHIGRQVSVLAEAMGMRVLFYDIVDKLPMGNAAPVPDLRDLLEQSDIVTLHVPGTPETENMITETEIACMPDGAYLINASRGSVVDLDALRGALVSGKLAGAAADVFPEEPESENDIFKTPIQNLPNVVLTPHIGGSTREAQRNIGIEVSTKLIKYTNNGSTLGAVNFPDVMLPDLRDHHRILHIHRNVPGVLQKVNTLFGERGINVAAQYLRTNPEIGYLIVDIDKTATKKLIADLKRFEETVRVRALF
jgi:D-3-phosphoglycerate dehydrogenase / 2-oxoglutarate reductase